MSNETVEIAMSIILYAGDARVFCKEALNAIADMDIDCAKEKLKEATDKIVMAHKIQTEAIQEETRGGKQQYSLLFTHAQDTLMTIYSELNVAKQLVKIFETYNKRLQIIEEKIGL